MKNENKKSVIVEKFNVEKYGYEYQQCFHVSDVQEAFQFCFMMISQFGYVNPNMIKFAGKYIYFSTNSQDFRLVFVD